MGQCVLTLKPAAATIALTFAAILSEAASAQNFPSQRKKERTFSYGVEADFRSSYVWRGIAFDNRPALQPAAWVSARGIDLTAWTNLPVKDRPESAHLHTTNLSLTYARDWKKLTIEPAIDVYVNRRVPGVDDPNTGEGLLKLSYQAGPMRWFTRHSFDIRAYRGAYFGEAGVSREGQITKRAAFAISIRSGWASSKFNDVYIDLDKPALNFVGADGSLTFYLSPVFYVQPHVEFSRIVNRQLREYLSWPTVVNFGLAMGFEF